MNIIKRELKANLKSLLVWIVPLGAVMYAASVEFSAFAGDPAIADAMKQFEFMFKALGSSVADMTKPEGFISIVSLYIYLPLAIYSGLLGSGIVSKEEKDKTAEYLFTLPVKRYEVIRAKLIVAVVYSMVINLAIVGTVYMTYLRFEVSDGYFRFMSNMSLGVFLTQIIFLGIGMLISSVLKQYKKSGSITIGLLMGTFMLSILIGMVDGKLDFLKFVVPFQYFPSADMLAGTFNFGYVIITLVVTLISVAGTFYFYKNRDLHI
ncbi:ABC transporter permease subunit [Mycoplasmatota bacterium zrk1]